MPSAASSPGVTYPQQAVLAVHPRNQVATHLGQIEPTNQYSSRGRYDLEAQQSSMDEPTRRQQKQVFLDPNILRSNRFSPLARKGCTVFAFFAIPAVIAITIVGIYFGLNKDTHYKSH